RIDTRPLHAALPIYGLENIWTADLAGNDLQQVSRERERQVSNPAWTPDGLYIVARKHFRNTRSLGSGEMWLYHVGGGAALRMTRSEEHTSELQSREK